MSKRIIALTLSVLMIMGCFAPKTTAYAAEDEGGMASSIASSGELLEEDSQEPGEAIGAEPGGTVEEPGEGGQEEPVIPEEPAGKEDEEGEKEPAEPEAPAEEKPEEISEEADIEESQDLPEETPVEPAPIYEAAPEAKELSLSLRDIDLMYGESAGNGDGHFDALFAPKLTASDGTAYELAVKGKVYSEEALYFIAEYKFFEDESAVNGLNSEELTIEEKEAIYEQIAETKLSTVPAGNSIYLAAKASASDGSFAYVSKKIEIRISPRRELLQSLHQMRSLLTSAQIPTQNMSYMRMMRRSGLRALLRQLFYLLRPEVYLPRISLLM